MSGLAVVSVIAGIFLVVARAPMIFTPDGMVKFAKMMIAKDSRIRWMGSCLLVLSFSMIINAWGSEQTAALVILIFGIIWTLGSILALLIFPSAYRAIAEFFLEMDALVLRVTGVLGAGLGILFICLGFWTF